MNQCGGTSINSKTIDELEMEEKAFYILNRQSPTPKISRL